MDRKQVHGNVGMGLPRPRNRFYRASLGPWFMEVKYLGVAYSRNALFVLRE